MRGKKQKNVAPRGKAPPTRRQSLFPEQGFMGRESAATRSSESIPCSRPVFVIRPKGLFIGSLSPYSRPSLSAFRARPFIAEHAAAAATLLGIGRPNRPNHGPAYHRFVNVAEAGVFAPWRLGVPPNLTGRSGRPRVRRLTLGQSLLVGSGPAISPRSRAFQNGIVRVA